MKTAALLILAMSYLTLPAAESIPLKLVQTIRLPGVKGRFDHFSIDAKGSRLFIAALGNNTLEVVDLFGGKRIQSVSGMSKPTGVLYLADARQIAVANGDDGTFELLDGATFKVAKSLGELADADNLRFDPKAKLAWLGYGDGALGIIDPAGPKLTGTVKLAAHPESFQLERQGPRIFVNLPDAKQIAVLDREKPSVLNIWPMGKFQSNFPMALDESNHRLFVGCRKPPRLIILDTDNGNPVADLAISGDTDDLFHDVKRKRIYVSCGEGFIDVVEQSSADKYQRLQRSPPQPEPAPVSLAPTSTGITSPFPTEGTKTPKFAFFSPNDSLQPLSTLAPTRCPARGCRGGRSARRCQGARSWPAAPAPASLGWHTTCRRYGMERGCVEDQPQQSGIAKRAK